ncbi:S41 family peptidase [Dysgonomonas alginatilytica]|nr:S41 family peptidase [Dysgonomonas alginatilytica]
MKNNNNKFILLHDSEGYTIQLDTVLQYPRNIYIIVDKECASSAEEFILISKQSSKVTILGENTSGCLDFSNVVRFDPKDDSIGKWWGVNYASTISRRLPNDPVDEKGIAPDIYLSPDKNWLD